MSGRATKSLLYLLVFLLCIAVPSFAIIDAPHNPSRGMNCSSCHNASGLFDSPFWDPAADPGEYNAICNSCHIQTSTDDSGGTTDTDLYPGCNCAPHVATHSSATTSDNHGTWAVLCLDCHQPHANDQKMWYKNNADQLFLARGTVTSYTPGEANATGPTSIYTYSGTIEFKPPWNAASIINKTTSERRPLFFPASNYLAASCPLLNIDEANHTITVQGDVGPLYERSGFVQTDFAIEYGQAIQRYISGTFNDNIVTNQEVKFFDQVGAGSFAFDESGTGTDTIPNGICQICHTKANHWRSDGTLADHYSGKNCTEACHTHANGFAHGFGVTEDGCVECHGHDAGTLYDPDMTTPYTPGITASQGKGTSQSHSTHTETDSDDLIGPAIYCSTCHDITDMPTFKNVDDSGGHTLAETDICNTCHSPGGAYDGVDDGSVGAKANWPIGIYDPDGNLRVGKEKWCVTCHDGSPSQISGATAPDKTGDDATYGYYITGHGNDSGTYNATNNTGPGYLCAVCHNVESSHISGTPGDTTRLTAIPDDGLDYTSDITEVCLDCHEVDQSTNGSLGYDATAEATVHSGAITGNYDSAAEAADAYPSYGEDGNYTTNPGYQCEDCHEVHGTSKLAMILPVIDGKVGGADNPITITGLPATDTDLSGLDPTGTADDGVCDACHASGSDPHPDTNHAGNHNIGEACITCHSHTNSFAHGEGATSLCVECHGHDAGSEYDPDMISPATLSGGTSSQGVGTSWSHSTHTETDSDDLIGPAIYCSTCHDLTDMPRFKNLDGSGSHTIAETDICDTCHSPGGTYDGVNDPDIGAKANWSSGIYDSGRTLKTGKERWCATCHDDAAAVINTITAPNVAGDENGSYTYGTGWGYYKTGHGLDSANTYPASGGLTYGAGKGCADCHDISTPHIDNDARSYSSGSSNYQAGYRLKSVDGRAPMTIPHPQNIDDHDPDHYALCLSCHDANKYLVKNTAGDPQLVTTSFRDDEDLGPWDGGDAPINIHEYHLAFNSLDFDSDWDGSNDSEIACVNCHNVHGSTQLSMIRDGKLVGREPGMTMYYDNVMVSPDIADSNPPSPANVTLADSTGTVFLATSPANICGHCHGGDWVKYYRGPPTPPVAPTLTWTAETEYTTDGVNPDSGQGGDFFTFRITYTDANYQPPRVIQVWVDEDNSGGYEIDEKFDMVATDSTDVDVTDGKLYQTMLAVDYSNAASITYRFYASDGALDATGAPVHPTDNTITLSDNVPLLAWTGEDYYLTDGVSPDSSAAGSTFTFQIEYTDINNQCPASDSSDIQVWIDENDTGDGTYESGEKFNMIEAAAGDTDCTDGKLYTVPRTLSSAGDGNLYYRFYGSDTTSDATGIPTGNMTVGVTAANSAPQLSWTGETDYVRDGVDPDTDVGGSTFSFHIQYSDVDNDAPTSIQAWVDSNDDGDYEDAGELVNLTAMDGSDTDYTDGNLYSAAVSIDLIDDGIVNYRFSANDGTENATGTPTEDSFLTLLTSAIRVSCPATGDYDYTTIQAAIDNASDGDLILVADGTCTERITIDNKDLTIRSVNGAALTIIDGSAGGIVVTMINGADTTIDGLTIKNGYNENGYGGGFSISNSSPTISNSIVTANIAARAAAIYVTTSGSLITINNSSFSANNSSYQGGALYLNDGTSAIISDTIFHNNHVTISSNGGAIYMQQDSVDDASLTISGSTFTQNTAEGYGGAIYTFTYTGTLTVDISNSIFTASDTTNATTITATRNSSNNKGGVLYMAGWEAGITNLIISDSTVEYGNATYNAGGMLLSAIDSTIITGSTFADNSAANMGFLQYDLNTSGNSISFTDSIIRDNFATGNSNGAMYMRGGTISFDRCSITGNSAPDRDGAGTISGHISYPTVTTIQNSIISGNKVNNYEGGGFLLTDDGNSSHTVNIFNSTFSGNYAGTYGGGIHRSGTAAVTITNSIFWRNWAALANDDIYGTVTASYSDIRTFGGYSGTNNINLDPLFVNAIDASQAPTSSGDYHLLTGSPVIDIGTNTGAPTDDFDTNMRPIGTGIDMGADEVEIIANNAPLLSWTAETDYSTDGVNPDTGAADSSFQFRVNYSDADNDAASTVKLWIDTNDDGDFLDGGEKTAMTEVNGTDTNVTDGKLYFLSATLSYTGDGVLNYRFYADDGLSAATGQPTSSSTVIVNTAPILSWLGSGNYVGDGVDPDSGSSGATFDFHIIYTDANNNGPTAMQVWVDKNDNLDYLDTGEKITMTEVDPLDTDYSDGKEYSRSETLNYAGNGVLNYRFYASDGLPATGDPATDSTLTITNSVPTLSWLGSGAYVSDGIDPNGGLSGTNSFVFKITYTDDDNQCPVSGSSDIQVWIDKNDTEDSTYAADEKFNMTQVDTGDTNCMDGKEYTYTATNLTRVGDDDLFYRFHGSDGVADATGTPATTDSLVGVFTANQAPDLDWTGEAGYTTDGVDPDSGSDGDNFTFRVTYTDIENTAPSSIQVWVDLDNDGTSVGDEGTELTTLDPVDAGDTAYDDGKLYSVTIALSSVTNPSTTYHFKASDGTDTATGNGTVDQTVTVVTAITVCTGGSCDFDTIQAAIDDGNTVDGDYILVKDGTYSENINYSGKDVTITSENGASSTTIQGSGANAPVVTFNNSETVSAVLDGFTIDNQAASSATRGLYIYGGAAPTIKNCTIQDNRADNSSVDSVNVGGGGVFIKNSAPSFDNCTIKANTAANRHGCGMYITGATSGATITNSTIGGTATEDGNKCTNGSGGGIYYIGSTSGTLTISDSNIQYNQGQADGGGIYLSGIDNTTTITNTTILDNTQGGSLSGGGGIYANNASLSISGTTINDNFVGAYDEGGGIYFIGTAALAIELSTINSNQTGIGNSGSGGGIYFNGTTLTMGKTNVRGNTSTNHGGGIMIAGGTATIVNSIIAGNIIASNDYKYGGGIANSGTLNLYFSTISDNYVIRWGGGLYANGIDNVYNSIISGNNSGNGNPEIYGTAEILYLTETSGGVDFVTPVPATNGTPTSTGNYSLQASSNCIDTGDAMNKPVGDDDIEGTGRPVDIGGKGDGVDDYDRGAYEYHL